MKTVGILTFCINDNCGTTLQMWALKSAIENMGEYEVHIIPHAIVSKIENGFGGKELYEKYQERIELFDDFLKKRLGYTDEYIDNLTIENAPQYDNYIVGSDTVWNVYQTGYDKNFFLDFVGKDGKKIAYAPSIGVNNTDSLPKEIYQKYLDDFDFLSVRENSDVEFVKQYTDKEVVGVLDPTLLLEAEKYDTIAAEIEEEDYILVYLIFDESESISYVMELANRLSIKYGMKVIHFIYNLPEYVYGEKGKSFSFASPEKFLSYIKNAKLILTNSFHGTTFSIIYRKAFYSVLRNNGKTKIKDLLERLQLEDRILKPTLRLEDINMKIDYSDVEKILERERKKSLDYLRKALEN